MTSAVSVWFAKSRNFRVFRSEQLLPLMRAQQRMDVHANGHEAGASARHQPGRASVRGGCHLMPFADECVS
jgi:hypothetical protein